MAINNLKFLVLDVDGTMTDAGVYITEEGKQFKKFNARDGMGIKLAINHGIEVGIISHSQITAMVESRANTLGMKYFYVGQKPKLEVLEEWVKQMGISMLEVGYIGDDVNDLEIMQAVGISACPSDAVEKIKKISGIHLQKKGGHGCVREFIDQYVLNG